MSNYPNVFKKLIKDKTNPSIEDPNQDKNLENMKEKMNQVFSSTNLLMITIKPQSAPFTSYRT